MRLGFLWKFNVVLGLCGLKILKKEGRQWVQERKIRVI
jgi:hypothetical protein